MADRRHHVPVGLSRVHDDSQDSIPGSRGDVQRQARAEAVHTGAMFDVYDPVGRSDRRDDAAEGAGAEDGFVDHGAEVGMR